MPLHNSISDGKAKPLALEFFQRMQPAENPEKPFRLLEVESHAIILYKVDDFALFFPRSNQDGRMFLTTGEFRGVREQLEQNLADQQRVSESLP